MFFYLIDSLIDLLLDELQGIGRHVLQSALYFQHDLHLNFRSEHQRLLSVWFLAIVFVHKMDFDGYDWDLEVLAFEFE